MKKILIIEDDETSMRPVFDLANSLYFNSELEFRFVPKSQDVPYANLESFNLIIVDLTLAQKSDMDGYGVIKKIEEEGLYPLGKLFILTGNSQVNEELKRREINSNIQVVQKPVTFKTIKPVLEKYLSSPE